MIGTLEEKLRLRLVTAECEVLLWLYRNGPTRSRDLAAHTKTSIANFQIILRRLRADGVIESHCDGQDGRVRVYDLADEIRQFIDAQFANFGGSPCLLATVGTGVDNLAERAASQRVGGAAAFR